MLFVSSKVAHLSLLPQGQVERIPVPSMGEGMPGGPEPTEPTDPTLPPPPPAPLRERPRCTLHR